MGLISTGFYSGPPQTTTQPQQQPPPQQNPPISFARREATVLYGNFSSRTAALAAAPVGGPSAIPNPPESDAANRVRWNPLTQAWVAPTNGHWSEDPSEPASGEERFASVVRVTSGLVWGTPTASPPVQETNNGLGIQYSTDQGATWSSTRPMTPTHVRHWDTASDSWGPPQPLIIPDATPPTEVERTLLIPVTALSRLATPAAPHIIATDFDVSGFRLFEWNVFLIVNSRQKASTIVHGPSGWTRGSGDSLYLCENANRTYVFRQSDDTYTPGAYMSHEFQPQAGAASAQPAGVFMSSHVDRLVFRRRRGADQTMLFSLWGHD